MSALTACAVLCCVRPGADVRFPVVQADQPAAHVQGGGECAGEPAEWPGPAGGRHERGHRGGLQQGNQEVGGCRIRRWGGWVGWPYWVAVARLPYQGVRIRVRRTAVQPA